MDMNFHFAGRNYLVTGGNRGIGHGVVKALLAAGANVAFTYRSDDEENRRLALSLDAPNHRAIAIKYDARDHAAAKNVVNVAWAEFGTLDGLVNNAGIARDMALFRMTDEAWESVIETNLSGTFRIMREIIVRMVREQRGKIVNIASVSGLSGMVGQANYSASKAGLIAMTKCAAREVARFNVQVNAVAPGFIETAMLDDLKGHARDEAMRLVPARRWGTTTEVAAAVMFMLSEFSNYMTGHTLVMDGGMTV